MHWPGKKTHLALTRARSGRFRMMAMARGLGVPRLNLYDRLLLAPAMTEIKQDRDA